MLICRIYTKLRSRNEQRNNINYNNNTGNKYEKVIVNVLAFN